MAYAVYVKVQSAGSSDEKISKAKAQFVVYTML